MTSFSKFFFFFSLLAALVVASPTRIQKRSSFKVERVRNANFAGHNGPRQLAKSYRKFLMPMPQGLLDALAKQAGGLSGLADALNGVTGAASGTTATSTTSSASSTTSKGTGKKSGSGKGKGTGTKGSSNSTTSAGQTNTASKNNGTTAETGRTNNTAAATGTGLVTATPEGNDVEFLSPVNIGGQTLNMDFDSGSSDMWVFSTQLSAQSTRGHTVFDPAKSKTFAAMRGATFSISYGDGSGAAGTVGTDTVDIGGATVTKQAVEVATAVSASFVQDTQNQGLVGLAFSKLNTVKPTKQKTFFDNVMPSLAEPVFTADLRKNAVGAYEFGRIDTTKFTGEMAWVPVNTTNGFWQFSSQTFAVNGGQPQVGTRGGQAIADTGTTLILASPATVQGYYSQVKGAVDDQTVGGITFPCDATMPDLDLDVGGIYMAKIKGSDINFTAVNANTCFGGLQATTSDLQIYGDIFFKSQFVAFNGGNNTLGVAQHV